MKKFTFSILSLLLLCGIVSNASAQTSDAPITGGRYFSLGPLFMGGASVYTGDVAEGFKIKARPSIVFGVLTEVDLSEAIAFNLGLTYETRNRYWYAEADEDAANYTAELGYLTLSPIFNFRHFLLGFGIRLPMSGTLITDEGGVSRNNELPYTSLTTGEIEMKTPIELKIGGNIEILETRGGVLNFIVLAGYDLSPAFKEVKEPLFNPAASEASLHLGLNYLFNAAELK